jgi:mRNA interferase MazF
MLWRIHPAPCRNVVEPRRGEVWWVCLDPTLGSGITKTRPCVILFGNVFNRLRRTVVVIPLSTSLQPGAPLLVPVRCDGREVVAVTDQVRAISKQRLDRRLGELSSEDLEAVEQGLREVLEL